MRNKPSFSLGLGMALIVAMLAGNLGIMNPQGYAAPGQQEPVQVKLININRADSAELQVVRGIGPVIAGKILQYRKEHGNFEHVEDIEKVPGIGKSKFAKIKTQITV